MRRKEPIEIVVHIEGEIIGTMTTTGFMNYMKREAVAVPSSAFLDECIRVFNEAKERNGDEVRVESRLIK